MWKSSLNLHWISTLITAHHCNEYPKITWTSAQTQFVEWMNENKKGKKIISRHPVCFADYYLFFQYIECTGVLMNKWMKMIEKRHCENDKLFIRFSWKYFDSTNKYPITHNVCHGKGIRRTGRVGGWMKVLVWRLTQ